MDLYEIEMQLWQYIDGTCDDQAKAHVQQMLATDTEWKDLYEQLITLHAALPAGIDLEQPSMRFTKNVIEAINSTVPARVTTRYINPLVIRSIAGLFIVLLAVTLFYAVYANDWTGTGTIDISSLFNSRVITVLLSVNVIAGLLFIDTVLHKRRNPVMS